MKCIWSKQNALTSAISHHDEFVNFYYLLLIRSLVSIQNFSYFHTPLISFLQLLFVVLCKYLTFKEVEKYFYESVASFYYKYNRASRYRDCQTRWQSMKNEEGSEECCNGTQKNRTNIYNYSCFFFFNFLKRNKL